MTSFFDGREVVRADRLIGPRVYSTDLFPSGEASIENEQNVEIAARALKIKMITRGLVTLNSAYLVSPLAVKLFDNFPDILGDSVLPVFRTDKTSLADLVPSASER